MMWLRSAGPNRTMDTFFYVGEEGGCSTFFAPHNVIGVSPAFRIG